MLAIQREKLIKIFSAVIFCIILSMQVDTTFMKSENNNRKRAKINLKIQN